jgi:hypothetical protein
MENEEILYRNDNVVIARVGDVTSPFMEYSLFDLNDLMEVLQDCRDGEKVDWSQAPDGTKAWAMSENGEANWYSSADLHLNDRFGDWQDSKTRKCPIISLAPSFYTSRLNWANSLVIRDKHVNKKYKVKIVISEE